MRQWLRLAAGGAGCSPAAAAMASSRIRLARPWPRRLSPVTGTQRVGAAGRWEPSACGGTFDPGRGRRPEVRLRGRGEGGEMLRPASSRGQVVVARLSRRAIQLALDERTSASDAAGHLVRLAHRRLTVLRLALARLQAGVDAGRSPTLERACGLLREAVALAAPRRTQPGDPAPGARATLAVPAEGGGRPAVRRQDGSGLGPSVGRSPSSRAASAST
jgi:hypothetical protein